MKVYGLVMPDGMRVEFMENWLIAAVERNPPFEMAFARTLRAREDVPGGRKVFVNPKYVTRWWLEE